MTDHAPIDQPILEILNAYNPLEVKDILINTWILSRERRLYAPLLA